jgi:hypothetical protein
MIIIIIILVTKLDCVVLCFVFLRLVYPMLPVSLCFSSSCVPYVASFSVFFFVMVSVLASSVVDRGFVGSSPSRVKPKTIKLIVVASPLSTQH